MVPKVWRAGRALRLRIAAPGRPAVEGRSDRLGGPIGRNEILSLADIAGPTVHGVLTSHEVARFITDGYVVIRRAVPPEVVSHCVGTIAAELLSRGIDLQDRSTWVRPVERIGCPETPAFAVAGTQPTLWEAYERLLGDTRWWRRQGVGGTIPVRFPHSADPADTGWHIDGSFDVDDTYWVNVNSRDRGLLCLFLFSDVGDDDAPTEIKVGSHLDVPKLLEPFGDRGTPSSAVTGLLPPATLRRPSVFATGRAGDVYVCHPFVVHRATWPHNGTRARIVAQPGVRIDVPFTLSRTAEACPVEQAILSGLGR